MGTIIDFIAQPKPARMHTAKFSNSETDSVYVERNGCTEEGLAIALSQPLARIAWCLPPRD
ncbi:hypothetical protein N181_30075 [Sinorhizobium fredii USDA 205]|nr:hypothetical protein N181_30075 [Sinorhizobium fredii USDA 205]GEC35493.1 hypothetical protein EFR01_56640 [Sinorhizobium fredii]GLS09422.1 hypothetical protein GCM10007864_30520 [Sinorhizobium fredii]